MKIISDTALKTPMSRRPRVFVFAQIWANNYAYSMQIAKLVLCASILAAGASAWAHNSRKVSEPAPVEQAGGCDSELKLKPESLGHQTFVAQIQNYFSHLPPEYIDIAVTLVEYDPVENLSALLEITRGLKDSDGNWIKKPLAAFEIAILFENVLPDTGVFTPGRLYNSQEVNRDPIVFYESILDLHQRLADESLTEEDILLIGTVRLN